MSPIAAIFGLLAEFETAQELLTAVRAVQRTGYRIVDAYTPYPVRGLGEALGIARTQIPFIVLAGGIVGACSGFFMEWWTMSVDYPFNVGGRPTNSWPVFIPIAFEVMILVASLSALFGMLFLNGLPRPNHPVFNVAQLHRGEPDRLLPEHRGDRPALQSRGDADAPVQVECERGP